MKQVSLRMDDQLHTLLTQEAKSLNKSLSQHILDSVCQRGHFYTTNFNQQIQVRFNLTYLGDLLVLGKHSSFNGLYNIMVETIKDGDTVIIERHYTNAPPSELCIFTNLDELEEWKRKISSIK